MARYQVLTRPHMMQLTIDVCLLFLDVNSVEYKQGFAKKDPIRIHIFIPRRKSNTVSTVSTVHTDTYIQIYSESTHLH